MSRNAFRLCPVGGYDIPALERWLENMAEKGFQFSMTAGPFTVFTRTPPARLRFHLEPARHKSFDEDQELSGLYQKAGWQYLDTFRKNYYVFATRDEQAQAHTDPDVLDYAIRRFLRQKAVGGIGLVLVNFLMLNFFYSSRLGDLSYLRYFWAELLAGNLIPFLLTALGLVLVDLAYLQGLFTLWRLHRRLKRGLPLSPSPGSRLGGVLTALSILPLTLVAVEIVFVFFTHGYFPYDLAGSNFVTMAEIEGPDFRPTGDTMYNMDYISHSDTPLTPASWYYQQWETNSVFGSGGSLTDIPHLEITITRYLLPAAAQRRAWEWKSWGGHDNYQAIKPAYGLEEIWCYQRQHDPDFYYLILRRGGTVLRVEYEGSKDLTQFLPRFAEMLNSL